MEIAIATFPALQSLAGIEHGFTLRTQADTRAPDFAERVAPGAAWAEQPHDNSVAVVSRPGCYLGVDALVTTQPNLPLLIRVADCAAVYIVDPITPAVALAHSGKRGTLLNLVGATTQTLLACSRSTPSAWTALISPCIGPCHYEVDLWTLLERQLQEAGIGAVHNVRTCTACHLDRFYSYRAEKGQTGRHFAFLRINAHTT
ncbi:MAG: polyphenol oxidase family protein [Verrucomicrobiae bacterium]|nr:polyphenol oxidase family protein [Verrucomicrobiae bacterium]MDW8343219.1 polyphenol oxidase family protein [Verrucomicrobiae bacterium]